VFDVFVPDGVEFDLLDLNSLFMVAAIVVVLFMLAGFMFVLNMEGLGYRLGGEDGLILGESCGQRPGWGLRLDFGDGLPNGGLGCGRLLGEALVLRN
jgi:hypothetical protein